MALLMNRRSEDVGSSDCFDAFLDGPVPDEFEASGQRPGALWLAGLVTVSFMAVPAIVLQWGLGDRRWRRPHLRRLRLTVSGSAPHERWPEDTGRAA
jgi:hypothetical protein